MKRGKWFFVYTYVDTFGGGLAGTTEHEEIPLNATTEDEANEEAKAIWAKKQEEAIAFWEKQKATWAHPPKTAFDDGPSNPRVIYKIQL
jgi:hypothetical protein